MKNKFLVSVILLLTTLLVQPLTSFTLRHPAVTKKSIPFRSSNCGASFQFYNQSSNTVTRIAIQNVGQSDLVFNNPSFPLSFPTDRVGPTTLIITVASGSGTFEVKFDDWTPITCEPYEYPHISPVAIYAECVTYWIFITNDEFCS